MSTNRRHSLRHQLVSDAARAAFGDAAALGLTETQAAALYLHRAGLNVFPLPYAKKTPWSEYQYRAFRYARPRESDIEIMFGGEPCNIAVQTGRVSGNLLVIDAESHPRFGEVMAAVSRAGVPLWAVSTHRGGHVYLRCADGEVQNIGPGASDTMPDVEVHGHSRYVLGPESRHPEGTIYTLERRECDEPPTVTLDQLREMFPGLPFKLASRTRSTSRRQDLNERTVRLIQGRIPVGERNNQLYTSARELLARGWDEDAARHLLVTGAVRCGLDERAALATFQSAVKNHYRDQREHTSTRKPATADPAALWHLAAQWATGETWKGRAGSTDRAVFLAMCERCKMEHPDATAGQRVTWRASVRELSELTGYTIATVSAALKRLQERGALTLAHRSASGYRYGFGGAVVLAVPAATDSSEGECITRTLYTDASNSVLITHSAHPAFDRTALGANAAGVLSVLLGAGDPLMPTAISRAAGLTVWKVRTALGRLERWHLAERVDAGWIASVDADQLVERLDDIAIESGALEAVRARREKHQDDRADRLLRIVLRARGMHPRPVSREVSAGLQVLASRLNARNKQPTAARDKPPGYPGNLRINQHSAPPADLWGNVSPGDADRCPHCGGPLWRRPSGITECTRCGAELTRGAA